MADKGPDPHIVFWRTARRPHLHFHEAQIRVGGPAGNGHRPSHHCQQVDRVVDAFWQTTPLPLAHRPEKSDAYLWWFAQHAAAAPMRKYSQPRVSDILVYRVRVSKLPPLRSNLRPPLSRPRMASRRDRSWMPTVRCWPVSRKATREAVRHASRVNGVQPSPNLGAPARTGKRHEEADVFEDDHLVVGAVAQQRERHVRRIGHVHPDERIVHADKEDFLAVCKGGVKMGTKRRIPMSTTLSAYKDAALRLSAGTPVVGAVEGATESRQLGELEQCWGLLRTRSDRSPRQVRIFYPC